MAVAEMLTVSEPAVAFSVLTAGAALSVQLPTVATPFASVVVEPPVTEPEPATGAKVTCTPATGPFAPVTFTAGATGTGVPYLASWKLPATIAIAVPEGPVGALPPSLPPQAVVRIRASAEPVHARLRKADRTEPMDISETGRGLRCYTATTIFQSATVDTSPIVSQGSTWQPAVFGQAWDGSSEPRLTLP